MLSTCTMIRLGKVYGNLMVDVKPSNEKLIRRCVSIVCAAAECDEAAATAALEQCGYHPKIAIVMLLCGCNAEEAEKRLAEKTAISPGWWADARPALRRGQAGRV